MITRRPRAESRAPRQVNETHGPYTFGSTSAFKPAENGHEVGEGGGTFSGTAQTALARGDTAIMAENGSNTSKTTAQIPKDCQPMPAKVSSVQCSVALG